MVEKKETGAVEEEPDTPPQLQFGDYFLRSLAASSSSVAEAKIVCVVSTCSMAVHVMIMLAGQPRGNA